MRILITGIYGFVGSNLVDALKGNHTLFGLDIVSPVKEGVVHTFSWHDLETNALPDVDVIIHLAGKAHDTHNQSEASAYFEINTRLTQKIFDYYCSRPTALFIFFSSVKAAADQITTGVLTEEVTPSPVGPYGESKLAAENYLITHGNETTNIRIESHPDEERKRIDYQKNTDPSQAQDDKSIQNDNKRVYILRPCMIHGQGNKGNLNLLYKVVIKGIPWPLGSFENKRSFASVDNVCYLIGSLIANKPPSGIYNLCDDQPVSTNRLIELIAESKGKKARIWRINKKLITFIARIGDLLHLPLNSVRLIKLTESFVVSNNKLKQTLGIEKLPLTSEEGMRKTFSSF